MESAEKLQAKQQKEKFNCAKLFLSKLDLIPIFVVVFVEI